MNETKLKQNFSRGYTKSQRNWGIGIAVILIIAFGSGTLYYSNGHLGLNWGGTTTTVFSPQSTTSQLGASGPQSVQLNVQNALNGTAVTSLTTESVYTPGNTQVFDTCSGSSNPIQCPGNYYTGNTYDFVIGKSGWSTTTTPITPTSLQVSGGKTYANLPAIFTVPNPTYSLNCAWNNNTVFSSAITWNFTTTSTTSEKITCTLTNTEVNTGLIPSWDPHNQQTRDLVCVIKDTASGQALSFSGYENEVTKGVGQYFTNIIPSGITQGAQTSPDGQPINVITSVISADQVQKSGITSIQPNTNAAVTGGSSTFSITVAVGSLAAGSTEATSVACYSGADVTVFNGPTAQLGTWGADQTTAAAGFTITWAK